VNRLLFSASISALLFLFMLTAYQETTNVSLDSAPHNTAPATDLVLQVTQVIEQKIPRYYSATGYTHTSQSIELSTSQSAIIREIHANEGDVVKAGALLVVLDETELMASIKQAKSAIKTASIRLKDRRFDFKNAKKLSESKVVPIDNLRKAKVKLDIAKSQLVQVQSELKRHEARQPYHRITSPIDARVIKRWVNQGDLASVGKPLLQLEAIEGLEFETAIPTQWLDKIHLGDRYPITLHYRDVVVDGNVSHIVHSTNRITQTSQIKLILDAKAVSGDKLISGLSGQIDFEISQNNHLLVPESSLITKAGVLGLFRLDNDSLAQFTPVKIERLLPMRAEKIKQQQRVVLSGISLNETIVLSPPKTLRDGMKITVKEEDQ
tara:strand:- start:3428 stop:4567 length:1140 start_codon:yes stop_codon:yes gene_type:complete